MNLLPEQLMPYETWDLTITAKSSPRRFYALSPCGVGTREVESLTSYVARLAEAHSVSLYALTTQEILPLLGRAYLSNRSGNSLASFWKETARALNGIGALARDWVRALEQLTHCSNLQTLTLLPWAAVLTQQRLLRLTRAWCPDCFVEWQAAGQPIYEPLLWNVNAVSVCLRHQRPLIQQCPYPDCQMVLPLLASQISPGYCSKCARWLGMPTDALKLSWTETEWHWQLWLTETVGSLLAYNQNLMLAPYPNNIPDLIATYRQETAISLQAIAERLQLSRTTLKAWQAGTQIPQLESLLRLCYCCGVPLLELFTSPSLIFDRDQLATRSLPELTKAPKRPRRPLDVVHIQQTLEATLANDELPPPSMRTMAKRLAHSPKELREHFPDLSRAISNRYKHHLQIQRQERISQTKENVRRAILELHLQGLYPNLHRVAALLPDPKALRSPIIWRFWRETLQELGLRD